MGMSHAQAAAFSAVPPVGLCALGRGLGRMEGAAGEGCVMMLHCSKQKASHKVEGEEGEVSGMGGKPR